MNRADGGSVSYHLIADWLREQIESGELPPGSKVPGEAELVALFTVDRAKARRALDVLKNDGLTYAQPGHGTYVREFHPVRRVPPGARANKRDRQAWRTDDESQVHAHHVGVTQEEASNTVAYVLRIARRSIVQVRRDRYLLADRAIQLATSYRPMGIFAGAKAVRFQEELRLRMPTGDERTSMALTSGTPVVEITRAGSAIDGQPVELSVLILDGNAYILEYHYGLSQHDF